MKRAIFALTALIAACALSAGWAEQALFENKSLNELYALRVQLELRIQQMENAEDQRVYESGSYKVGRDIPAGDYVLVENENAMFASMIIREGSSEASNLLAHHLINNQLVARLQADTWFTLSEAKAYPISGAQAALGEGTSEGGYLVGVLIPEGRYALHLSDRAPLSSYSVYDGVIGTNAQLTKFEVVREEKEIELKDGEYIELSGCWLEPAG